MAARVAAVMRNYIQIGLVFLEGGEITSMDLRFARERLFFLFVFALVYSSF